MIVSDGSLTIEVDDRGAFYPVTIDPLMTTPSWSAESDQAAAKFGYDVQKMLEVIVGARDEKERRDRHERGEQHGRERQRAEHQHGHLEQAQPRPDENLHYEERGKAHRERREEQKWQLEACRQRLCRTRIGAGDETEEPGQSDDGDDGVSQLAAKGDTLDDFVEESLSVAEQRFEEVRVVRDRLVRGHASNPGGLRPKLQIY